MIKYILNDGTFKVFANKCGHKGDINQWQDIHNVLVATYEVFLKSAVEEHEMIKIKIRTSGSG